MDGKVQPSAGSDAGAAWAPRIAGMRYLPMLEQMHAILRPEWYLEVGTFTGKSLTLVNCNYIAVDPAFRIKFPVVNSGGKRQFLFQETSDAFFASGFLAHNGITVDFAFLDGLHHFEVLLRDFINAERHMAPGGVIALHDCCPLDEPMTSRTQGKGAWTGDVWKTLLILLRNRPDLRIDVAAARPTGLVVIRDLDPANTVLSDRYDDLVAEYAAMSLDDLPGGLRGLYDQFPLVPPARVLADFRGARESRAD